MITSWAKQTHIFLLIFVSLLLGLILALWPKPSFSQTVLSQEQAGRTLAIEKVAAQADGTVSGEIRNNSKNTIQIHAYFAVAQACGCAVFAPNRFHRGVHGDYPAGQVGMGVRVSSDERGVKQNRHESSPNVGKPCDPHHPSQIPAERR